MQTNTNYKFLVNIDSYIDILTMYVLLKKQFWKINSSCKLKFKTEKFYGFCS